MRLHYALLLVCGATVAGVVAAGALSHHRQQNVPATAAEQVFDVRGQVRGFQTDGSTVRIAHEEIPGFMPAMEMPFTVKDPSLLRGLAAGDAVKFRLVVTKDDSWITHIEKIVADPKLGASAAASPTNTEAQSAPLPLGQQVPDFTLTDQHGRPLHLHDFHGKAVVLTFIYTRCPLPNYCPLMSKNFASLQERFSNEFPGKVQLLSISFDPQFDTPETLNRYAALFQKDDRNWTFATGTPEQVNKVTGMFGLVREPASGFINHDLRTALISPEGRLLHVWRSNVWTPFEVQRMVREKCFTLAAK